MTTVHVIVPDGVDDPDRPSGGNTYDRHLCRGLASIGWLVREHAVPGAWPARDPAALAALAGVVARIPEDAIVVLDGLLASPAPEILVPQARRLRMVVLVHMPLGHGRTDRAGDDVRTREGAVLAAAAAVVVTSAWTRSRLRELYGLRADRVHVAEPAVDPAGLATGTPSGGALLCVAAVTHAKGHDLLLDALAQASDLCWRCLCVGSLEVDPAFVTSLRRRLEDRGLADRVALRGPLTGSDLALSYDAADLLVLPSRAESYGMVVTEALAHGLPVVATQVGGVPDAVGHGADGTRPGLLVPPDDPAALGTALRAWLADTGLRERLRRAARERRQSLPGWPAPTSVVAGVLAGASR